MPGPFRHNVIIDTKGWLVRFLFLSEIEGFYDAKLVQPNFCGFLHNL